MPTIQTEQTLSRGHKKRERTCHQLIIAGLQVLADKGESLTISDVVAEAKVSNGTFYNYFADREELIDALAEHSLISLAAQTAIETTEADPVRRFAIATLRVLRRAEKDPTWGGAVLRLGDHRRSLPREIHRYMKEDLAAGFDEGRFEFGPDEITLDLITGLLMLSIRRIVQGECEPHHSEQVLSRALRALGVRKNEAARIATELTAD